MHSVRTVGKREFIQHTSKYLRLVEKRGDELVITHQNEPDLLLTKITHKSLKDLRGLTVKVHGDVNEPVLPEFEEWC
jgi:antitoxin (DNA-binding transcriptional repressor) of toxin-antitoxin stability system